MDRRRFIGASASVMAGAWTFPAAFASATPSGTPGVAYAVYFLTSDIRDAHGPRHREWLESMILLRSRRVWRTALLHSTRLPKPGE